MLDPPATEKIPTAAWPYESILAEEILEATLELVIALVTRTLEPADAVSVSLVSAEGGEFHTPSASSPEVREVDGVQYENDAGPCLGAIRTGRPTNTNIASDGDRWPEFAARAAQRGFASVLALPLVSGDAVIGALNIYSRRHDAFTSHDQGVAAHFAHHAATVLESASRFLAKDWIERHLGRAVSRAERIGQAEGILIANGYSPDEAHAALCRASQRTNRSLGDVAQDIVNTGRRGRPTPAAD